MQRWWQSRIRLSIKYWLRGCASPLTAAPSDEMDIPGGPLLTFGSAFGQVAVKCQNESTRARIKNHV